MTRKKEILDVNILCSLFVYTRFRKIKDELSIILRINLVVSKTAKLKSKTCPFVPCPPSSHNWPSQFISTPPWVELSQNLPPLTREKKRSRFWLDVNFRNKPSFLYPLMKKLFLSMGRGRKLIQKLRSKWSQNDT